MNNKIYILVVIALTLGILGIFFPKTAQNIVNPIVGGSIHNTQESFDEGIAVDGVELITGKGQILPRGKVALGVVASSAITAAQIMDNYWITIDPTYDDNNDFYGASISLPTEATMNAAGLNVVGECKTTYIENIASVGSSNIDIYLGDSDGYALHVTSSTSADLDYDMIGELKACAVTGVDYASISWDWSIRAK